MYAMLSIHILWKRDYICIYQQSLWFSSHCDSAIVVIYHNILIWIKKKLKAAVVRIEIKTYLIIVVIDAVFDHRSVLEN